MRGARVLVVGGLCLLASGVSAVPAGASAPPPDAAASDDPTFSPGGPGPAAAPDAPGDGHPTAPGARGLEAETEVTLDRGRGVFAGAGFSGPLGFGASLRVLRGLSADVREEDTRVQALCALPLPHCAQGFLFQLDAGTGGGKVSLGVGARARVDEEDFRGTAGFALRAALVRTWGNPVGTDPGLTYLGPELDLSVLKVNLTLGVLWRLGGHAGPSALFSWGVGFGL